MGKNTIIDGIAASEHLDSSGESLSIEGMDISSLGGPDSILNWEHGSKDRPGQVVGKITFARKIMKKEDAKTKREIHFWNKSKKPFVYIKAELFDGLGHSGAQDVAAMLKYKNKDKGQDSRLVVGFSIEGGKIEKKGMNVTKSIARDVAITVKPCNKVCDAEVLENNSSDEDFLYKNQDFDCEILEKGELLSKTHGYRDLIIKDIKKSNSKEESKEIIKEIKLPKKITEIPKNWETDNNMRKTLIAGIMNVSPDAKTGMAALAPEMMVVSKKKLKKNEEDSSHDFLKPHTMFSVENPHHPTDRSVKHEDMINKLKKEGFDAEHINGKYNNKENSIIVKNPDERQRSILNHIARKLGQDAIIHSDGKNHQMLFLNGEKAGQHIKGVGTQVFEQEPENFYSTTQSGTHFAHNFDFDKLHKNEELTEILQKMSRPLMQNKEMGLGQDPKSSVIHVDPEKKFNLKSPESSEQKTITAPELESKKVQSILASGQKNNKNSISQKNDNDQNKDLIKPRGTGNKIRSGMNISEPSSKMNRSYVFKNPKNPSNEIGPELHETTHGFFADINNKYSPEHSKQLISHLVGNYFHPNDVDKISSFLKKKGYKEGDNFNEEHISHIADIINRPSVRKKFFDTVGHVKNLKPGASPEDVAAAQELDRRTHKRLNRGWQDATNFIKDTPRLQEFFSQVKSLKNNKKK